MTQHDGSVAVAHMRDFALEAQQMASGFTPERLGSDRMRSLALVRLVELIGEAASRVPEAIRTHYPSVPWRDLKDTRNRLIHGYDGVDLAVLLHICHRDLPALCAALDRPSNP